MQNYSDYIVYVDESGDHSLTAINPRYPVFSLAFCVFKKSDYARTITPALIALKFKYWGHGDVVLHERDIRKSMSDDWAFLNHPQTRESFLADVSQLVSDAPFHVVASVIEKQHLLEYATPKNPYELAVLFCMERLNQWLLANGQAGKVLQVHFEARGKPEDEELERAFHHIRNNGETVILSSTDFQRIDYRIRFLNKIANSAGLQIADLIARPIGLRVLRPQQKNRVFDIVRDKLITRESDFSVIKGVKIYPVRP